MSSFESSAVSLPQNPPDPHKHVNYTLGMVLGVDDFTQEFAYLSGRDQLLARELLGYGTVCGLQVTLEPADNPEKRLDNPQVRVGPGLAVTPPGQFVTVPAAQCAILTNWLAAHAKDIEARLGAAATTTLPLYLVLCYRDCLTNQVPIPGEPCRSEDEAFAASRVTDDFKLDLLFDPPEQREEDALRDFVEWLNQVPISEVSDSSPTDDTDVVDEKEWEQAIRDAAFKLSSPPSSPPDFMYGSPPANLHVRAEDACAFLRVAFRLWTTELRPIFLGHGQTCAGDPPDEGCLLLADLRVPLVAGALGGEVTIDESRRPYLLHLRLIQEWLLCGRWEVLPSDLVVTETEFGQEPFAGVSQYYSRADHTHGSPALGGDVSGVSGDLVVERLRGVEVVYSADGPQPQQVLTFVPSDSSPGTADASGTWQPQDLPDLAGDVVGPINKNTIESIRDKPVIYAPNTPGEGQVLKFIHGAWRPDNDNLSGDVNGPPNQTEVVGLRTKPLAKVVPTQDQMLVFVNNQWQPTSMGGDVGGPVNKNVIQTLQGKSVQAQNPNPNDILSFDGTAWRPRPEAGGGSVNLIGDVGGTTTANRIKSLQGIVVDATAPTKGQVLTYVEDTAGKHWVPADNTAGNAVTHPSGLPVYQIVAAGTVLPDGVTRTTMYNGLKASVAGPGLILVTFNNYRFPNTGGFTYIVKALPVFDEKTRNMLNNQMPTIAFHSFTDAGFNLIVFVGNKPLDSQDTLARVQLMIEVSRYEIVQ